MNSEAEKNTTVGSATTTRLTIIYLEKCGADQPQIVSSNAPKMSRSTAMMNDHICTSTDGMLSLRRIKA